MGVGIKRWSGTLVLLAGFFALFACSSKGTDNSSNSSNSSHSSNYQPQVLITNSAGTAVAVQVELARTPAQRERGLMFRRELAPGAGMLFLFPDEGYPGFWMKNTLIPLDLIFIAGRKEVVGIVAQARPESLEGLGVNRPAKYVLEVNAGFCEAHRIKVGNRVKLIGIGE